MSDASSAGWPPAAQTGAVLVGLAATAALGWSWLDPAIGLRLAGWAI